MQHQINLIHNLVSITLNPENNHQFQLEDQYTLISELTLTREKLYTAIRDTVFGISRTSVITRQVRQVQYDCIELLNVLSAYGTPKKETELLFKSAITCLEHILQYLRKDHSCFFNVEVFLPLSHYQRAITELQQAYTVLKMVLKKHRVPQELLRLITDFVGVFLQGNGSTFRQMAYVEALVDNIINLHSEEEDYTKSLKALLVYLRFNDLDFVGRYVHLIRKEVSELYDIQEQYEFLCTQLKWLCALPENALERYDLSRPGLKKIWIEYVTAELDFLERSRLGRHHQEKSGITTGENYRVKLAVSASVLAYFIRLLIETEVVLSKPRTLLLTFVARYFETKGIGSDCLSAGSLETKYKQVSQNTMIGVCALLKQLLRRVEQQI